MKFRLTVFFFLVAIVLSWGQSKVGGHIFDGNGDPVAFANIVFKSSSEGTTSNENGRFYLESDETWDAIVISFIGYETLEVPLSKKVNFDLKITLNEEAAELDAVVLVSGKQPKKNNVSSAEQTSKIQLFH